MDIIKFSKPSQDVASEEMAWSKEEQKKRKSQSELSLKLASFPLRKGASFAAILLWNILWNMFTGRLII